jgi:glutamyl-tRNA(Gln) amidotransferase subunit E
MFEKWQKNYQLTLQNTRYKDIKDCTIDDYDALGFRCGLEVHQQLKTEKKLFCRCPAGHFHDFEKFDAEIIRHMRPTLSELGVYDGTALMEFRTKKEIVYRINNATACTYEMDDTPPFPINREALEYGMRIAHLLKMNIVGELHITRKQYLDGSIPTGFQRTTIMGIEGEIQIKDRKIRLIQFSVEEDSCREVSDYRHRRVYFTDRLGMPLIETVTYPDMLTPYEAAEACQNIRFIARSTGQVRTGIGAGRQDVNVSVTGGTRVEIKGVAHIKWIPKLTHTEAYRQHSLLLIKDELNKRCPDPSSWQMTHKVLSESELLDINLTPQMLSNQVDMTDHSIVAVNLPYMYELLSHFNQPNRTFADEIADRLKVIACIEKPNLLYSEFLPFEDTHSFVLQCQSAVNWEKVKSLLRASENDAQLIFWTTDYDYETALETISERMLLAFQRVPNETRKSRRDGTNIFERVLPGPDRMYPDTDSKPVSLTSEFITLTQQNLPESLWDRYEKLKKWGVPTESYTYILRNNLTPLIEKIVGDFSLTEKFVANIFASDVKHMCGKNRLSITNANASVQNFDFEKIYTLIKFIKEAQLDIAIIHAMIKQMFLQPSASFTEILERIPYIKATKEQIITLMASALSDFERLPQKSNNQGAKLRWVMGKLKKTALGNADLREIAKIITQKIGGN